MWLSKSTCLSRSLLALGVVFALLLSAHSASAQACCAGTAAVAPGRLMLHEPALVGGRVRTALGIGSYDANRNFRGNPRGTRELDFEQDVFGVVRVLRRGQVGVLVPVLESWRDSASTGSEFGAGIGDVRFNARYDFMWAGENQWVPGIALLLGASLPTGRAPEDAKQALGSDATGEGAARISVGIAFEQVWGPVLAQLGGVASKRANRHLQGLSSARAIEWSILGALGYSFPNDVGIAGSLAYTLEGNSSLDGATVPHTNQALLEATAAVSMPLGQSARLQAALFVTPPLDGAGRNRHAETGASLSLIRSLP